MSANIAQLRADLAAAENELLVKQYADLEVAVENVRQARDKVESLVVEFKTREGELAAVQQAYLDAQAAIIRCDKEREAKEFPSKEEVIHYGNERQRLVDEMQRKRQMFLRVKGSLDQLRLEVVKADQVYIALASIAKNLKNQLEQEKENANQASRDSLGRSGGAFGVS